MMSKQECQDWVTFTNYQFSSERCNCPEQAKGVQESLKREWNVRCALGRAEEARRLYADQLSRGERPHRELPDGGLFLDLTAEALIDLADEVKRLKKIG